MAKYFFILTEDNNKILQKEGLYFSTKDDVIRYDVKDKPLYFTEYTNFYNCGYLVGNNLPSMGGYSYTNSALFLPNYGGVLNVGNYCSIASRLAFKPLINHPITAFSTSSITYDKNFGIFKSVLLNKNHNLVVRPDKILRIYNDVWIGNDVMLSLTAHIGQGAVIATRANVTKDVPPYAVVGGNPAKIIKYRFEDKIIEKLLETRWTEYDIAPMEINGDIPVEQFIDIFYDYKDKGKIKPIILKNLKEVLDRHAIPYEQC